VICPTCHGNGYLSSPTPSLSSHTPCPECNGSGIAYCCGPPSVPDLAPQKPEPEDDE
jgi:hypothetical protein